MKKKKDTSLYDYSIKAGGAIIFDEGGSHRGSSPTLNDRMVLRHVFSKFKKLDMKIIIFGGSGFLEKNLASFLQKKYVVTIFDKKSFLKHKNLTKIQGDIENLMM